MLSATGLFFSKKMDDLPRLAKQFIVLATDASLCVLAVWIAFYLRLGQPISYSEESILAATIFSIIFALPILFFSGIYLSIFRSSGSGGIFLIIRAIGLYAFVYAGLITGIGVLGIPKTIGLIQPLLLIIFITGSRWLAFVCLSSRYHGPLPKVLIYGAGKAGQELIAALDINNQMKIVGFLDDDKKLHGHTISGKPIFSQEELPNLISSKGITQILLAIPSASRRHRNDIIKRIENYRISIHTIPSLLDLTEGRVTVSNLQELDINDLLGREAVKPDGLLLTKNITGKVMLVTGAGGSIGSELCRQISQYNPSKLLLLEINEFALYSIHAELEEFQASKNSDIELIPLLASAQDKDRMQAIISTWKPNTIYHAAAYKHVPLVEYNLTEGVKNNIIGTLVTAQAAIKNEVSNFILISTDKAVRPTNAMGASKRLAELCLQSLFAHQKHSKKTQFSMVRFGNVINSSGSVIPKFRKQIQAGGPITLTHPDITRYFMTIREAAQLVIQAGSMATGGDVFILDMGEPIRIADLAQRMVSLSGLTIQDNLNPDGDIKINITGIRPGEKLYEELLLGKDPRPTSHPKIQQAHDAFISWEKLEVDINLLQNAFIQNNLLLTLSILEKLVTDYKPSTTIVDCMHLALERQK